MNHPPRTIAAIAGGTALLAASYSGFIVFQAIRVLFGGVLPRRYVDNPYLEPYLEHLIVVFGHPYTPTEAILWFGGAAFVLVILGAVLIAESIRRGPADRKSS